MSVGSTVTFGRVLALSKSKGAARLVLLAIANHAKKNGAGAYPKLETIAREANMSVRNVQRQIPKLVDLGELTAMPRTNDTYLFAVHLEEHGDQPSIHKGDDRVAREVTTTSPPGDDHVTVRGDDNVAITLNRRTLQENPLENASSDTGGVPEELRESVVRILALEGNRLRGKQKRYRCRITRDELEQLARSLLALQTPALVCEALEKFGWGDGFMTSNRFHQRMALRRWVLNELPPLMDTVEDLLKKLPPSRAKALIRQARDTGRDDLAYITTIELHRLHGLLKGQAA